MMLCLVCQHELRPYVYSAPSSLHFVFGESSAFATPVFRGTVASLVMTSQSATTETFGSKARELQDIYKSPPSEEGRKLLLYKSSGQNKDFMKDISRRLRLRRWPSQSC